MTTPNYHAAQKNFRYVSLWMAETKAAMTLWHREKERLSALKVCLSKTAPLDFNFIERINKWREDGPISKVLVNSLPVTDEKSHPIHRMMKNDSRVKVMPAIFPFEGMTAYQAKRDKLNLEGFEGGERLLELLSAGDYSTEALSFLQAIAHEPEEIYVSISHAPYNTDHPYKSVW